MSPKQSGPGVGLISIVKAFSFRRDETRPIALNIAKLLGKLLTTRFGCSTGQATSRYGWENGGDKQ
jgi:hypothetical protein